MLHVPPALIEPAPRAFARLLRVPLATGAALFGDDVGDEEDEGEPEPEWLRAAGLAVLDQGAVRLEARAMPALTAGELKAWLVRTLGEKRGVLTAWPALPGLSETASKRVLALPGKVGSGHAWWWLWHLQRSVFSRRDSYTTLARWSGDVDPGLSVYRLAGEPGRAFDWFPGGASYGIERGVIDAFLHFGLTVTVRDLETHGRAPSLAAQVEQVAVAAFLPLHAASYGLAPPVFALMLVHDGDEYVALRETLLPHDAVITPDMVARLAKERSANLRAIVTVTQVHTFCLSDMLRAYVEMDASENRKNAQAQVTLAVQALAAKVSELAAIKVLKLNMTPDTVVFCPELADAKDGDADAREYWELRGYGFTSRAFDSIKGKPFLWDFDPRLCKRLANDMDYAPNAASVLMLLILLETTRAQCGDEAYDVMRQALFDVPAFRVQWRQATERADAFAGLLGRTFQNQRTERGALASSVFVDVGAELTAALRAGVDALSSPAKPRFAPLVARLLGALKYDATQLPSKEEQAARRASQAAVRGRFAEVASERHARLVARYVQSSGK